MTCLARAPLELVPLQPIKSLVLPTSRREKKPLIVETVEGERDRVLGHDHDDRATHVEVDKNRSNEASSSKTNADIVESKNDRIDTIAKGAESRNDNVAHCERDEIFGTKTDVVTEDKSEKVPQEHVEQATAEAPRRAATTAEQQTVHSNDLLSKLPKCLTMQTNEFSNELLSKLPTCRLRQLKQSQRQARWTGQSST